MTTLVKKQFVIPTHTEKLEDKFGDMVPKNITVQEITVLSFTEWTRGDFVHCVFTIQLRENGRKCKVMSHELFDILKRLDLVPLNQFDDPTDFDFEEGLDSLFLEAWV